MGGIRLTGGLGEGCGWYKANWGAGVGDTHIPRYIHLYEHVLYHLQLCLQETVLHFP